VETLASPGNTTWNTGWAAGGGIEAKITRTISAKLEYLYVDLGNGNCTRPPAAAMPPSI